MKIKTEWRAWRLGGGETLEHRWFKSAGAAERWADRALAWHLIEQWDSPPAQRDLANHLHAPHLAAIGRGELPAGAVRATWRAWGVHRAAKDGTITPYAPQRKGGTLEHWQITDALHRAAYQNLRALPQAPTGELSPHLAMAIAEGFAIVKHFEAAALRGGTHASDWIIPTRRGLLALSHAPLLDLEPERITHHDTSGILITWKARAAYDRRARRDKEGQDRWDVHGVHLHRERLEAWLLLCACLRRDREAAERGRARVELPGRARGHHTEVLSVADGVVLAEVHMPRRNVWLTWQTTPAVSWAPSSALAVARVPDGYGADMSSVQEHSARDWAERYAEELRAQRRSVAA